MEFPDVFSTGLHIVRWGYAGFPFGGYWYNSPSIGIGFQFWLVGIHSHSCLVERLLGKRRVIMLRYELPVEEDD